MTKTEGLPISVKGIVLENGRVWLRKNPRGEWELPGGRVEDGEQPEQTVVREIREELGFKTSVAEIVHAGVLEIPVGGAELKKVFIVSYLCNLEEKVGDFEFIGEDGAAEFDSFLPAEIAALKMPEIYKVAVERSLR